MQIIIFDLKGKQYAIKTDHIEEISELLDATFIPNAPNYIKGLVNLRGNVITLIDIAKLLHLELQEDCTKIIIATIHEEQIGILVGDVWEVMNIQEDRIERVNAEKQENQGIEGIIQIQDRIINFLDLEKYLFL